MDSGTKKERVNEMDLIFHTAPQNCGQMITEAYACDEDGVYCMTTNAAERTSRIEFASWDQWDSEIGIDFWNDPPPPIDRGEWVRID